MAVTLFVVACFTAGQASAAIIASNGPSDGLNGSFPGVSILLPSAGGGNVGWNNIEFSFFNSDNSANASGDLFILNSQYLGTPSGLSNATAGFVAQSVSAIGGAWQFDSSLILNELTTYYFLTDEGFSWVTPNGSGGTVGAGALSYFASGANENYFASSSGPAGGDWDYRLQGTTTTGAVPEPSILALLSVGLAVIGFRRRKQA